MAISKLCKELEISPDEEKESTKIPTEEVKIDILNTDFLIFLDRAKSPGQNQVYSRKFACGRV